MSGLRTVVSGLIGQHPLLPGMTWHYLQYLLSLRELGHDVWYLEDSGQWPYTLDGGPSGADWTPEDCSANVAHLAGVMDRFGFAGRWCFIDERTRERFGLGEGQRREVLASADLVLNVSGSLVRPWDHAPGGPLVYIDTDPAFTQVKVALGGPFAARVAAHDVHFSYGELLPAGAPPTPFTWRRTRQPIALSEWRTDSPPSLGYSTVMSWTSYEPLVFGGRRYAQKDVQFAPHVDLPGRVAPLELRVAMPSIRHDDWESDRGEGGPAPPMLRQAGWVVDDAGRACGDLDAYRSYLQRCRGEWSVAKHGYVSARVGWLSERTACYLAAGRPAVVEDTGIGDVLPTGEGLVTFTTTDEAVGALGEVEGRYRRHAEAAAAIAREHLDGRRVLAALLGELGAP